MMQALGMKKLGQCCVEWVNRENDRRLKEAVIATLAALKGGRKTGCPGCPERKLPCEPGWRVLDMNK